MTINHHPSDSTLTAYAGGALEAARRLVVASHLERCAACRSFVHGAEQVAGVMMENMPPATMSADAMARTLARIEAPAPTNKTKTQNETRQPACLRGQELGPW